MRNDEAVFSLSQQQEFGGEAVYARAPFLMQAFAKMLTEKLGLKPSREPQP